MPNPNVTPAAGVDSVVDAPAGNMVSTRDRNITYFTPGNGPGKEQLTPEFFSSLSWSAEFAKSV